MTEPGMDQNQQSVFQTIRLMLLSFSLLLTVLFAVVGVVGVGSLRELQNSARSIVELEISELLSEKDGKTSELSGILQEIADDTDDLRERLSALTGRLEQATVAMEDVEAGLFADVGAYLRLAEELQAVAPGELVTDQALRERARAVLERLLKTEESEDGSAEAIGDVVLAEILYNAAGTASRLQMPRLASGLAQRAWEAQKSPEYETRLYRSQMEAGDLDEGEGLGKVIGVLDALDKTHNIHLTLSETFNVAVASGRLEEMVGAFDRLIGRLDGRSPSYAYVVRAEMKLLIGFESDVEGALADMSIGLAKLSTESPNATWFDSAVSDSRQLLEELEGHPAFGVSAQELRGTYGAVLAAKTENVSGVDALGTLEELLGVLNTPEGVSVENEFPEPPEFVPLALGLPQEVMGDGWAWYSFVAEAAGQVLVEARTAGEAIDPRIVVWAEGTSLVGSDDDSGEGYGARVGLTVEAGVRYSIGVGPAVGDSVRGAVVSVEAQ